MPLDRTAVLAFVLSVALACAPVPGHAESLVCPEIGPGAVPDYLTKAMQAELITSSNGTDVANEVRYLVNRLQVERPNVSNTDIVNVLIAAYCPAVANARGLSAAEKWRRMREFDAILQHQLAADAMPPGSLVIADVPLPPAVYRELRSQAAAANQTPAQLMGAILTRAAGQ
jgi:hypothetical protein